MHTDLTRFLADHPDVAWFDAVVIDLCGNAVGKRLPVTQMAGCLDTGTPVCAAMTLVDVMGNTADPMGHGFSDGDPDAMAFPVAGTLAPVPWSDGTIAQALFTMRAQDGTAPLWFEPRHILHQVTQQFLATGLTPVVALELEFYLIDPARAEDGAPLACRAPQTGRRERQGQVLSLAKLDEYAEVIAALQAACLAQNLPVTTVISEYGPGQFEINLQHQADPLAAADHAALLRRCVRGMARKLGYDATFMPKPFGDLSGNGLHIHASVLDGDGSNIFDGARADGDTRLGHAVAGLQATMHEAMAIFAPNLNTYRRFKPDEFTPVTRDWGENNRSVAFRLPPAGSGAARRLEHRVSGADANPYLVTAAVLAGMLHGLENRLDPGAKQTGNAGAEVDDSLPLTLWQALDALRAATILPAYLGQEYLDIYAEVKAAEFDSFMDRISTREYNWYL